MPVTIEHAADAAPPLLYSLGMAMHTRHNQVSGPGPYPRSVRAHGSPRPERRLHIREPGQPGAVLRHINGTDSPLARHDASSNQSEKKRRNVTPACAGIYASPEPFESGSNLGCREEDELERRCPVKLHTQTSSVREIGSRSRPVRPIWKQKSGRELTGFTSLSGPLVIGPTSSPGVGVEDARRIQQSLVLLTSLENKKKTNNPLD